MEKSVERKKRGKKKMIIALGVVAVLAIGLVIAAGYIFMGPLKGLATIGITNEYDPQERPNEIVFYGASNFALWSEMENDIPEYRVQNHGFGGSTDKDLVHYAEKLLYPYEPSIVFFQTGSNDYVQASGTDAEKVAECMEYKREMFADFHERLPDTVFVVISGLLLPGRSEYVDLTMEVNRQLQALCDENDYMMFVDTQAMTYDNGIFREDLFLKDGIHLNHEGQLLWAREYIIPAIAQAEEQLGDRAKLIQKN